MKKFTAYSIFSFLIFFGVALFTNGCGPQEQTITVTGKVVYQDYSKGTIYVSAFDRKPLAGGKRIERTKIVSPGNYSLTLTLPAGSKSFYINGFNDLNENGIFDVDQKEAFGAYPGNPILPGGGASQTIDNVDVYLRPGAQTEEN